jgi:hypothetical protein
MAVGSIVKGLIFFTVAFNLKRERERGGEEGINGRQRNRV